MARNLESRGYWVDRAYTVGETQRRLEAGPRFDVALINMDMADDKEAGLKLLQWIKERQIRAIPVVLTGHGDTRNATESRKLGAFDYVEKGVEGQAEIVNNVIRQALRQIQANRSQSEARQRANGECAPRETRGVTILVVDDERGCVGLSAMSLESNGYSVLCAANFEDALATFAANYGRINLVITDIDLDQPRRSGFELVAKLRETRPGLKAIYTGGGSMESPEGFGVEEGAKRLHKPYSLPDLLRMVSEALQEECPLVGSSGAAPTKAEGRTA